MTASESAKQAAIIIYVAATMTAADSSKHDMNFARNDENYSIIIGRSLHLLRSLLGYIFFRMHLLEQQAAADRTCRSVKSCRMHAPRSVDVKCSYRARLHFVF